MRNIIIVSIVSLLTLWGVQCRAAVPVVYIETADSTDIISRDEWGKACIRVVMPDGSTDYVSNTVEVKSRGHSSFSKPKKPYTLKLAKKAELLGMNAGKRWVLLANFMDHSLLRNMLAFRIARATCMEWTPDCRPVDVVVNGTLQGCYLLCEQIRAGRNRVDIDENNGWLLEIDSYFDEPCRFRTAIRHLPVNVKVPKKPTKAQLDYITGLMNTSERLIYDGRRVQSDSLFQTYLDKKTFADWWLVHELAQNAEPNGPRSCYMYKDRDSLLKAGPVWDFDLAFIPVGVDAGGDLRPARLNRKDVMMLTADSLYNRRALWFDRLLVDSVFKACVKQRWHELKPRFMAIADEIDGWIEIIRPSAEADARIWQGKDLARFDDSSTFEISAARLKEVYCYRLQSLDVLIDGL